MVDDGVAVVVGTDWGAAGTVVVGAVPVVVGAGAVVAGAVLGGLVGLGPLFWGGPLGGLCQFGVRLGADGAGVLSWVWQSGWGLAAAGLASIATIRALRNPEARASRVAVQAVLLVVGSLCAFHLRKMAITTIISYYWQSVKRGIIWLPRFLRI